MAKKFFAEVTTRTAVALTTMAALALAALGWQFTYPYLIVPVGNLITAVFFWFTGYTTIPSWLLVLLVGMSSLLVLVIFAHLRAAKVIEPTEGRFTEFSMFDFVWRWEWDNGKIINLTPHCPRCERIACYAHRRLYDRQVQLGCEHCNLDIVRDGTYTDMTNDVRREIVHLVRTEQWTKWVEPHTPLVV